MSRQEVSITEAVKDDTGAIVDFLWRAWREAGPDAPGFAGATEETIKALATRKSIAERVEGPQRRMFIAKHRKEVVGFSAIRRVDDELVELAGIIVLESMTGKRIGSRLCRAAIEAAKREGYGQVRVRTEIDNDRALGFYKSHGFRSVRSSTEVVGDTEVAVAELVLDLTRS